MHSSASGPGGNYVLTALSVNVVAWISRDD